MAKKIPFKPEYLEQAKRLALLGAIDKDMAEFFGISLGLFRVWKRTQPGFNEALNTGKVMANANVAHSLYKRAMGFSQQEVDIRVIAGKVVETIYTKKYPADVTACIFFLKNRAPDLWNNRSDADSSPAARELQQIEAKLRAVELERATFIMNKMKAAETDTKTKDDKTEFLAELASRLPD